MPKEDAPSPLTGVCLGKVWILAEVMGYAQMSGYFWASTRREIFSAMPRIKFFFENNFFLLFSF